ncbi:neuronal acetylcholine receptor subunit alpha-2-like [Mya arenaria]|uniref:neuronal acetylcholine receptor subunit alpha-2-like n=1 Tax=Mya arenaria TaxID=6604 RepID=UPI0022E5CA90|nr:neuronal acetylcholine receptor subunit alpha-2-like [Mya arenaria]
MYHLEIGIITLIIFLTVADGAYSAAMETEIRNQTVYSSGYDPISRPAEVTHVKIGLNVLAIDELDIKGQKLSVAGWLTLEWQDDRLQWNKTEKNDIEYMFTKPKDIWKPELIVDNSLRDLGALQGGSLMLRVLHTGHVEWTLPQILTTSCQVDITYYPYDEQKCAIEIVSWGFRIDELSLDHLFEEVNLEDFVQHGEWMIVGTALEDMNLTEHLPDGSVVIYPQVDFWLHLRRRTQFYNLNVMMPVILTSILATLVFMVPVESGEKVSFVLTVFLSLAVLLTIVSDSLPPTSITVSVLGVYLGVVMVMAAFGVFLTVLILLIHHRPGNPGSSCVLVKITRICARVLCMEFPRGDEQEDAQSNMVSPLKDTKEANGGSRVNITQTRETSQISSIDVEVTWVRMAEILDRTIFILFLTLTLLINIIFVAVLAYSSG